MMTTDEIPPSDDDPMSGVTVDDATEEMSEDPATDTLSALSGKAPETINLVASIGADEQLRIADEVYEKWDTDWKGSAKYRKKKAQLLALTTGELPEKDEGYAQIHYPIIMKAIVKLHARVYDQQFPSNGEFWGVKPTSAEDLDRCVRVAKHMNWQTNHQISEYVPNHDHMIMQWYVEGSIFSFMYWSPVKNRPCHEWLPSDDVVLPYAYPQWANDPSLADLPRITRIVRKRRHGRDGLNALAKSGYYDQINVDAIFADDDKASGGSGGSTSGGAEGDSSPIREVVDRAVGIEKPATEEPGVRVLLEQHTWWKLPEWDDYRPVIATIDRDTKKLIAFILREDEDPEDRARYNREKLANEASYQAAMAQYEQDLTAYYAGLPMPQPGVQDATQPPIPGSTAMGGPPEPGPTASTQLPAPGEMTPSMPGLAQAAPPLPPVEPPLPAQPKMIPINFFTHYVCIPNPEGIYGYGIGYLLEGNNITADAIASAMVDSAKLSNMPTGIRSRELKIRGGEFRIKPGEIVEVDCLPSELAEAVHLFKFPGPEPQFAPFIKDMREDAEELSGASEVLSGEVGGSNETATTTQIRVGQALAAISIQNKRYTRARTNEGKILARLNSVYLGDKEYFPVIDPYHRLPPTDSTVGRMDYLEDVSITVTADLRMASQPQRLAEAQQALQTIMGMAQAAPWLQNPQLIGMAVKDVFIAMERPDLAAQAMPPPGYVPPGMQQPQQGPQAPPPGGRPVQGPPQGRPAPQGPRAGQPRPHPAPPGPTVPNSGGAPANSGPMAQ